MLARLRDCVRIIVGQIMQPPLLWIFDLGKSGVCIKDISQIYRTAIYVRLSKEKMAINFTDSAKLGKVTAFLTQSFDSGFLKRQKI